MKFLTWNNQKDAEDSLVAINTMYGCPYLAENDYRMAQWDFVVSSFISSKHGFYKPEERLGKEMGDLMPALMPGFTEHEEVPEEFIPEEDDPEEDDGG